MGHSEWTIEDARGNIYTADGVSIDDGWIDFTVGRETTLQFVFNDATRQSDYEALIEFGEYLYDGAVETGTDYREVPYYKEYVSTALPIQSFLWKVVPDEHIQTLDGYWMIITNVVDNTQFERARQKISVTGFVLAPVEEGNRTLVEQRYGVE